MKKLFSIVSLFLLSVSAFGQTNPTAQSIPYSQNFGTSSFSTLPAGWAAWNGVNGGSVSSQSLAESSAPTGNATLAVATAAQTAGGSYGYGASSNGKLYVQTSSNATNGANQFALAINTTGKTNLTLSYDVEIISAQPRTVGIVAQYRVGTSGSWTTISGTNNPYSQAGGSAGLKASPSLTLPAGAENQPEVQIRWAVWRGTESGNSSGIAIDNISISQTNNPPTASSVSFSGTLTQGQILTGSYTYSDSENDLEGTSTFKWYRSDDASGTNKTAISGAVNLTFSPTASEVGKYISFEVTPVASTGSTTGTAVESSKQGPITASSNNSPVASGVTISGTVKEGQTLTGNYTYSDTENDVQGTSTFKWFRSNDGSGTGKSAISGATNTTYNLTTLDAGKYISFQVTPVASTGTVLGNAVESSLVGPVEALPNDAPVASNVTFSGSLIEGQTLTGSYTYSDTENNTEGTSTKKWYRSDDASGTNQAAISGATALTYQLTASDLGKYISFEVTPVATVGTLTGSAVASTRQGPVVGTPTITTVGTLTSFGTVGNNTVSAEKTYKVTAKNLTTNLVISAPTDYKISLTTGSGFVTSLNLTPSSGTVDTTTIYVVFAPTSIGAKSGNITHTSTGATDKTIAVSGTSAVALPLVENFEYNEGELLTGHGWTAHSGGGTAPIAVGALNGLTYSGYTGSGIGNAAIINNTGEDVSLVFSTVSSGTIYFSTLVNVKSNTAGYFLHLGSSTSSFAARIYIKASSTAGKINFGLSNTSTATFAPTPTDFDDSTTYLLIVKYNVSAAGDASMWILNSGVPSSEAEAGLPEMTTTGSGLATIDRFCLRQYSATQHFVIDGIHIGTTWESAGLPVELTSFNLSKNSGGINLTWSTATESNNAGFEIEKSLNQIAWNKIGFIHGKGTTTEAQTYQFQIPQSELKGTKSWFRLKQVDFDGSASYSNILTYEEIPETFSVGQNYPNPFNPETTFRFNLSKNSNVKIVVSNVLGQQVAVAANREFNAGSNIEVPFNAAALSSGLYYYTITANGKSITKTMMLMK